MHNKILYKDESYRINGAIFEVDREKGCGFLEAVYQECLAKEFVLQGIPFREKPTLCLKYKSLLLQKVYQLDFICYDAIIVELKAVKETTPIDQARMLNYLTSTGLKLGLLVHFGVHPKAEVERFANSPRLCHLLDLL